MKQNKLFLILSCLFLFAIYSCKTEVEWIPNALKSSMSGKIDGVLLECSTASAGFFTANQKTTVQIIGAKDLNGFSITLDDFKGVGTYKVSDTNIAIYQKGVNGLQEAYIGTAIGTIQITNYIENKTLSGTFEFKGETSGSSKTITEGKFTISLIPVKIPETNTSTNNLSAKIDGTTVGFTGEAILLTTPLGKTLSIISANGDKRIILGILAYKGLGTYTIDNDAEGFYMKDQSPAGSFSGESGTLKITSETSNRLKGTFSFIAPNEDFNIKTSAIVTEGTFDLPFSKK